MGEALLTNQAALRYLKKIGCIEEGILKQHVYFDFTYFDVIIMSLFRDDYFKQRQL